MPSEDLTPNLYAHDPDELRSAVGADSPLLHDLHRVWNDKALGLIYEDYAHNTPFHLESAEHYGRDAVMTIALQTLAAFPDLRVLDTETIWSGNEQDGTVSQRVTWSGRHLGHGIYGPPSGAAVQIRVLVQRRLRVGRVVEEWLVRDEAALLRQLGHDPGEWISRQPQSAAPAASQTHGELVRAQGQQAPPLVLEGDPSNPAELPGRLYGLIWNARMLSAVSDFYAPDAVIWGPGNRRLQGHADLQAFLLQLLSAFPDAVLQPDEVTYQGNKVAARWTFMGTHDGPSVYGPPAASAYASPASATLA
ncbi:ester cyclase (plasmid) [Deinococcus sp. KNUC1210]|uniref:ester cyclase n=1 Tax=Deinococcus sp. KNUC1210 TaxID=2917691 RepID=UPI001EF0DDB6|nr:ester cyclase [Deinococcus sp. KNUC1210]ULH17724.1 ester cyclase [Deinococcus sp. KNUC1210]